MDHQFELIQSISMSHCCQFVTTAAHFGFADATALVCITLQSRSALNFAASLLIFLVLIIDGLMAFALGQTALIIWVLLLDFLDMCHKRLTEGGEATESCGKLFCAPDLNYIKIKIKHEVTLCHLSNE